MKKFFKKGIGVTDAGGLGYGIVIVLFSLALFIKCTPIIEEEPEGLASRTNLNDLYYNIQDLLRNDERFESKITPLNVEEEYVIVGFDKEWDSTLRSKKFAGDDTVRTECGAGEILEKPFICGENACICIFNYNQRLGNNFNIEEGGPVDCKMFDEDIVFFRRSISLTGLFNKEWRTSEGSTWNSYVKWDSDSIIDSYNMSLQDVDVPYSYLFRYGEYSSDGDIGCEESWGTQTVYLEKFERDDNKINILITLRTDDIKKRSSNIKAYLEFKKILDSFDECVSRNINESSESCYCSSLPIKLPKNYTITVGYDKITLEDPESIEIVNEGLNTEIVENRFPEFETAVIDALYVHEDVPAEFLSDTFFQITGEKIIHFKKYIDSVGILENMPEDELCPES
ncbi:hypothetical protein HQ529_05570 [Candidatus Woesearchaeota archaeon]|nr:hypothetical protein [Candidatus Woesearchaeota archaeon]